MELHRVRDETDRSDAAGCLNTLLFIFIDSDLLFASFDGAGSSGCNGDDAVTKLVTCLLLLNHCGANVGSLLFSITLLMNRRGKDPHFSSV